jgi:DNA-binding MarR family transcriptional regulator
VDGASYFDPGEPAREVALILLEATALPRRLAASRPWPTTLRPHEWQVLLAIALGSAQVAPEGAQTPRGIASALALDLEDVYDALDSLRRERLASIEFRDPEVPEAEQEWSLTPKGATAAAQIVGFAGRVIGWPPAPPSALG